MKKQSNVSVLVISRMLAMTAVLSLAACAKSGNDGDFVANGDIATPTVDYVEQLDVSSAEHQDSFLNQLAMNYRSYAIYNARTSGYPEIGELFAQKAVAAFSGEVPFPESLNNWTVADDQVAYELSTAYNEMIEEFKNDASDAHPEIAAELQAKYDCWLSAYSSGQMETAEECRTRFNDAMKVLRSCSNGKVERRSEKTARGFKGADKDVAAEKISIKKTVGNFYPETEKMNALHRVDNTRDGIIVVNNVNIPERLINPEPVQPMVFNQNIYGGDKTVTNSHNVNNNDESIVAGSGAACGCDNESDKECSCEQKSEPATIGEDFVTRQEFIDMMMAMRQELAAINARLDNMKNKPAGPEETTIIKVQQIPLEPKQHVMEEVFEIRFDFNKATIKPEYEDLIRKLVDATQNNKNIKVSVVGHTDTSGSKSYNYALGGRRAEAVQKMLINYGIPSSQIVAVSAGEEDLKVPTPDGTPNAENRRVRVVKETSFTESAKMGAAPIVTVEEYEEPFDGDDCSMGDDDDILVNVM
ncbi:MAG: OmpA family protein [Alphaproteobacteria bacterium]|nr:OmpA family protein [Alphaproteobacteria bacterium]